MKLLSFESWLEAVNSRVYVKYEILIHLHIHNYNYERTVKR
jgi:hypothetical protein